MYIYTLPYLYCKEPLFSYMIRNQSIEAKIFFFYDFLQRNNYNIRNLTFQTQLILDPITISFFHLLIIPHQELSTNVLNDVLLFYISGSYNIKEFLSLELKFNPYKLQFQVLWTQVIYMLSFCCNPNYQTSNFQYLFQA